LNAKINRNFIKIANINHYDCQLLIKNSGHFLSEQKGRANTQALAIFFTILVQSNISHELMFFAKIAKLNICKLDDDTTTEHHSSAAIIVATTQNQSLNLKTF